jgi:phage terminase small subunit
MVEDKEFIEIWNAATEAGKNLKQVALDLGIAPASASVRASLLRKKGNNLNEFRRGRRKKV